MGSMANPSARTLSTNDYHTDTSFRVNVYHIAPCLSKVRKLEIGTTDNDDQIGCWLVLNALELEVCKHTTKAAAHLCAYHDQCEHRNAQSVLKDVIVVEGKEVGDYS